MEKGEFRQTEEPSRLGDVDYRSKKTHCRVGLSSNTEEDSGRVRGATLCGRKKGSPKG